MKAIILSAGHGRRLLPFTEHTPKCLVPLQGRPMLAWQIDSLERCGITDVCVVVGYGADQVEQQIESLYGAGRIRTLYNPFFDHADNLVSCWVARIEMLEDFMLLNGDTLFDASVPERLLAAPPHPITLAVSCKSHYDDDDMKVVRDGNRLTRVGKKLPLAQVDAESIGMMTFRGDGPRLFRDTIERTLRTPLALRQWYLSLIDQLADQGVVWTQLVPAAAWTEVDCPADLQRASAAGSPWLSVGGEASMPATG